LSIQGGTDGIGHLIDVSLGGHSLGIVAVNSMQRLTFNLPLAQSWLVNGANTLSLLARNGPDDISLLASARITYQHVLRADGGALEANLPGGRKATVGGFAN